MKIPEIIIYDFDGVICDSVNIKTRLEISNIENFTFKLLYTYNKSGKKS